MKKLSVVVAGTGQIQDVSDPAWQPRLATSSTNSTCGITCSARGRMILSLPRPSQFYDKVNDGEKVFASTKAEVGITVCA